MNVDLYKQQIAEKCRQFNIKTLYLVGSAARGEDTDGSDLDFVVRFNGLSQPGIADRYFNFHQFLEELFAAKVDLIEESAIKNPFFKQAIEKDKTLIYG